MRRASSVLPTFLPLLRVPHIEARCSGYLGTRSTCYLPTPRSLTHIVTSIIDFLLLILFLSSHARCASSRDACFRVSGSRNCFIIWWEQDRASLGGRMSDSWMALLCPVHYIPGALFASSILLLQRARTKPKSKCCSPPSHSGRYAICIAHTKWLTQDSEPTIYHLCRLF